MRSPSRGEGPRLLPGVAAVDGATGRRPRTACVYDCLRLAVCQLCAGFDDRAPRPLIHYGAILRTQDIVMVTVRSKLVEEKRTAPVACG